MAQKFKKIMDSFLDIITSKFASFCEKSLDFLRLRNFFLYWIDEKALRAQNWLGLTKKEHLNMVAIGYQRS